MGFRRGVRITFSYNECRIAPRGPSLAAAPGLATVGAGVIARSPRRGSDGVTSRRATFAQPMILKEPNTVNLRPSAPTSNTVNIVLMAHIRPRLHSPLQHENCALRRPRRRTRSQPTATYAHAQYNRANRHPRPNRFNLFNKALRRPVPRPDQPCQRVHSSLADSPLAQRALPGCIKFLRHVNRRTSPQPSRHLRAAPAAPTSRSEPAPEPRPMS